MRRVVVDTDLGIGNNDCQALVLAIRSPELAVEAVPVCAGNLTAPQSLRNALTLVEYLGRPGILVLPGAAGRSLTPMATWSAGPTGHGAKRPSPCGRLATRHPSNRGSSSSGNGWLSGGASLLAN